MQDSNDQRENAANSDKLNQSGTHSSSGGTEDILGKDGDKIRDRKDKGEVIGNKIDTDNEGRVTQDSNSDL